ALTALLRATLTALQRSYLVKLVSKLGVSMSSGFLWHALRLPVAFFFARSPGDLVGRMQLNDAVASMLSSRLSRVFLDLMLVAFQSLMASFIAPIGSLAQFGASLQQLRGNVERLEDVQSHAQDPEVASKNGAESVPRQLSGELALRGLTFGYLPFTPPLVEGF